MTVLQTLEPDAEIIGYLAASLVLLTFLMRSMLTLRLMGLASNIAFLAYAHIEGLMPILVLHMLLVPINIYRIRQLSHSHFRKLKRRPRSRSTCTDIGPVRLTAHFRLRFQSVLRRLSESDEPTSSTLRTDTLTDFGTQSSSKI